MLDSGKAVKTPEKTLIRQRERLAQVAPDHGLGESTVAALAAIVAAEETINETMSVRREAARNLRIWLPQALEVMPEAELPPPPDPERPWTIGIGNLYTVVNQRMRDHTRDWALLEAGNVLAEAGLFGGRKDAALKAIFPTLGSAESASAAHRGARQGLDRVSLSRDIPPEARNMTTEMWASAMESLQPRLGGPPASPAPSPLRPGADGSSGPDDLQRATADDNVAR